MAQVIILAKEYNKRPSEMVGLDDYLAYCIDEVAFFLMTKAMDKDGHHNWNKFRWQGDRPKNNSDFVEFIKRYG